MLNKITVDNFIKNTSIAGVEVIYLPDGKTIFHGSVLNKSKASIDIVSSFEGIENLEIVKNNLPEKTPVALVINGKGIIHKKTNCGEKDTDKTLLQKVLPNANTEDFYIQKTQVINSSVFVSVMRKSLVDDLLKDFDKNGISVVSCSFGPFCVNAILPLIESTSADFELKFSTHSISVKDQNIENYQVVQNEDLPASLNIGSNKVNQALVICFAAAFQYFIKDESLQVGIPAIATGKEEYKQRQLFQLTGWGILIVFLSVLMINYFVFNHYWNKKNEISSKVSMNQAELSKLEKLENEVTEKQQFFEKTGLLEASRTSYYADQLAQDLPNTIQLTMLDISPLVKKINVEESISFLAKTIEVSGNCKKSNELNNWIKIIKKKKWVNEVALLNYSQDKSKDDGEFSIELKIK